MENASKALLIGGGILIAMLTISIGVYLFITYSNAGSFYEQRMETSEIQKFNANFTKFEGRENITIQEIVSLANFAEQYEKQTGIHIKVIIPGTGDIVDKKLRESIDLIELIENNSDKYLKCTAIRYKNGRVNGIIFWNN